MNERASPQRLGPTRPGRFITLEGGEGCGKSTQAKLLATWLETHGIACLLTREPGGEEGAEAIRALLVEGAPERWEPVSELLLFLAARHQHHARRIAPALARGEWVVCDRFHDSTRAYQGIARKLGLAYCDLLHAAILGNASPDVTFFLDIAPQAGLMRSSKRAHLETRFESMELGFHESVRQGFLTLAAREPERFHRIDAAQDVESVFEAIVCRIEVVS